VTCDYAHTTERGLRACPDAGGYVLGAFRLCLSHHQRLRAVYAARDAEVDPVGVLRCPTCGRGRAAGEFRLPRGGVASECAKCRGVRPLAVPVAEQVSAATGGAARVLGVLVALRDDEGCAEANVASLAVYASLSRYGTQKALRRLEREGDLAVVERGGRGRGAVTRWRVVREPLDKRANRVGPKPLVILGELRAVHRAAVYGTLGPSGITERLGAIVARLEGEDA
jgi:hypothetical protein